MNITETIKTTCESFKLLNEECCTHIVMSAKSLSIEECYDSLLITVGDLSAEEIAFAERLHRYGRAIGVKDATEKLFAHMSTKNGADAAVTYLRQMGGEFSVDVTPGSSSGFAFNVNLTGKK